MAQRVNQPGSVGRQFLIAAGTSIYKKLQKEEQRPEVAASVTIITECFTRLGYQRELQEISDSPTRSCYQKALDNWLKAPERTPDDILALYYCGHGISRSDGHYLLTRDSDPDRLVTSAIRTEDLARLILEPGSRAGQVLLILDTCYAGRGVFDVAACLAQLYGANSNPEGSRYIYIMASTAPKQEAQPGAFANYFSQVVLNANSQCGGPTIQLLQPETVAGTVAEVLRTKMSAQSLRRVAIGEVPLKWLLFPNPIFDKDSQDGEDLEGARRRRDYPEHWIYRAKGGELASPAWYFSGRKKALFEITRWLRLREAGGVCVVTGSAGPGKSAILGWLVACADNDTRSALGDKLQILAPPVSYHPRAS